MPKAPLRPHIDMAVIEAHCREALEQEIGVGVPTSSPREYQNMVSDLRKEFPEFNSLIVFAPANGTEVFICKKEVSLTDDL